MVNIDMRQLRKVISLKYYRIKREDFEARMRMERTEQRNVEARLTRFELAYKNKTRIE